MRRAALFALALVTVDLHAGHGLINSFADLEWLPPPGTTPADFAWPLECAEEAAQRWLARSPARRRALLQAHARERLAEIDATVRAQQPAATARGVAAYAGLLDELTPLLADAGTDVLRAQAEELLAQQYMLSTNYLDLPRATRPLLLPLLELAAARYQGLRERLPAAAREALFFKEEEVRWSYDMAVAADAQGL